MLMHQRFRFFVESTPLAGTFETSIFLSIGILYAYERSSRGHTHFYSAGYSQYFYTSSMVCQMWPKAALQLSIVFFCYDLNLGSVEGNLYCMIIGLFSGYIIIFLCIKVLS